MMFSERNVWRKINTASVLSTTTGCADPRRNRRAQDDLTAVTRRRWPGSGTVIAPCCIDLGYSIHGEGVMTTKRFIEPPKCLGAPALAAIVLLTSTAAQAGDQVGDDERITAVLRDGSSRLGELDARTDESNLWLFRRGRSLVLSYPVAWREIREVVFFGRRYEVADFRRLALLVRPDKSITYADLMRRAKSVRNVDRRVADSAESRRAARMSSIHVSGWVTNWDADAEADGVALNIEGRDAQGNAVEATGSLRVVLLAYNSRTKRFAEIESWAQPLRASQEGVVRLPFRRVRPEVDLHVGGDAVLHAQLASPGAGVLRGSTELRIRSTSRLRDQLQLSTGARMLPAEGGR